MTEAEQRRQDYRKTMMLTESLPKIIIRMAAPSIVSFLITSIYNLADTFFVSSLGTNATAAVSVNASLDQIIMMAGSMLAVGAAFPGCWAPGRRSGPAGSSPSPFSPPWPSARW